MFAAARIVGVLGVSFVCAAACTSEPDSLPTDALLPEACDECLTRFADAGDEGSGCGTEESACSADADCEQSMLCVLTFDCLESEDADACAARHDCTPPAGTSTERLAAFEACARTRCAVPCHFR